MQWYIKFYTFFVLFSVLIVHSYTASFQIYNGLDSKKCTDQESGREYYVGEAFFKPGKCIRMQCLGNLQLWEDGCSAPKLEGDCKELPGDLNLSYPKCCPKYECRRVLDHGNFEEIRIYNHYGNLLSNSITQLFVISQAKK